VLLEDVRATALADRQAELSAAIAGGWEDYEPISIAERVAAFEATLAADPAESVEARDEQHVRELRGVA
jgi:hypothetical protein